MAALVNQNDKSDNEELYTDLFQQVSDERWLRSSTGSISCKFSAILYIIIHDLINKIGDGTVTDVNIPTITRSITNAILRRKYRTESDNKLYQILTNNGSSPSQADKGKLLNYGTEITGTKYISDDIVYAGLVNPSSENPKHLVINHYFLIIKNKDKTFNIVSSYGSDDVSMIQKSVILDIDEFDKFIRALKVIETEKTTKEYTNKKSEEIIRSFMGKYFLSKDSFRSKSVNGNYTGGRTTTNISLIPKEIEIYANPSPGRGFHIDSYDIVPTLRSVIENELKEFSISQSAASAENKINMGGGNYKKYRTRKRSKRKHKRKSKYRKVR